jgi:hypothetical protein
MPQLENDHEASWKAKIMMRQELSHHKDKEIMKL